MINALIVSGGKGIRMGEDIPKQYLPLDGIPIIVRTIRKFDNIDEINNIFIVLNKEYREFLKDYTFNKKVHVVIGGKERHESVLNGLKEINKLCSGGIVLIHDGVRPFVSKEIILNSIKHTKKYKACAPGVSPKDSLKIIDEKRFSNKTLDRSKVKLIQTPQAFYLNEILDCHNKRRKENFNVLDDTELYEKYYDKVYIFKGSYNNIKITTKDDFLISKQIIK